MRRARRITLRRSIPTREVRRDFATPAKYIRFAHYFAGAVGIEPTPTVLETVVLPLNYAP